LVHLADGRQLCPLLELVLNTTEMAGDRGVWPPNITFKEEVCVLQAALWDGSELAD